MKVKSKKDEFFTLLEKSANHVTQSQISASAEAKTLFSTVDEAKAFVTKMKTSKKYKLGPEGYKKCMDLVHQIDQQQFKPRGIVMSFAEIIYNLHTVGSKIRKEFLIENELPEDTDDEKPKASEIVIETISE